jgi:MFS transporter, DHA1 family, inner membrane transport protein
MAVIVANHPALKKALMPRLLWLFCLVNLAIGSAAFVMGGIVGPLARDLGVSLAAAGQAMTAYALATAMLAPLAMLFTGTWPKKRALLVAVAIFLAGNTLCALAPNLPLLLLGRVLMGLGAMFTPLAAGLAVSLVAPQVRGKALAFVFMGISLSYVVGVPLGAWLADAYSWQVPIWVMSAALAVAWLAIAVWVPADLTGPGANFTGAGALIARGDVWPVLCTTLLYFVAIFAVFSFVAPVLQALVPMPRNQQALTLSLFGVAGVVGTLVGGWANDRFGAKQTLVVGLTFLGAGMLVLPLTQGSWPLLMAVLLLWGVAGFALMAPQQARLAAASPPQTPLLLSLNASMLYVGTALGAVVGGVAATHLGLVHLAWAGVPFVATALVLTLASHTSALPATSRA